MGLKPVVRFDDVEYRYPNGSPVVSGFTLAIDPGEVVVLGEEGVPVGLGA